MNDQKLPLNELIEGRGAGRRRLLTARLDAGRVRFSTPGGAGPWMLIVQEEQEHDCDLLAIGRHGRHVVDELLLGSTTRMVISEGAADVLIASRRAG